MITEGKIQILNDANTDIGECLIQRDLSEFKCSISGVQIKHKNYQNLLDKLKNIYDIEEESYEFTKTNKTFYWREKNKRFYIFGRFEKELIVFDVFTESYELNHFLFKIIEEFYELSDEKDIIVTTPTLDQSGIKEQYSTLKKSTFENIDYDFYPYIDVEEMFSQFTRYDENILCLLGKSGLGKTALISCYLKFMSENPDMFLEEDTEEDENFNILYIKSEELLASDVFWSSLEPNYYQLIVLDDLDYFLGNRNVVESNEDLQKIKFISNLLSYTDGMQQSTTKIIITTNREVKDIDDAILRKGRMFDVIELRELTNDEALHIWLKNELPEKKFKELFRGDILAAELGSEIKKYKKDKKESIPEYIKEEGISILTKYSKHKKVGF